MKKITKTIAGLLLAIQLNAQSDTTSLMIRGKCTYQFDYKTNERLEEFDTCYNSFNNMVSKYYLNNSILCLDLFDKGKTILPKREITMYFKDGRVDSFKTNSKDETYFFNGDIIKSIKISKPKL
tara:strand:+ start:389 stop:760 length:372 start_codon:yes stop_codon:yes gene_type:complete